MQFYLDSAKLDEIEYARKHWNISGVTTNPRIIMSTGKSFQNVLSELADIVKDNSNFPVFVQINPYLKTATEMMEAAKKLISFSPNFVIKIPCTEQGNVAAYHLEQEDIRTALTLVFSAAQSI